MYVDNVRNKIGGLKQDDYKEYIKRLRLVLKRRYSKNVKPSELKQRVDEFVGGKDPKIESFEAYLITFDELSEDRGIDWGIITEKEIPKDMVDNMEWLHLSYFEIEDLSVAMLNTYANT